MTDPKDALTHDLKRRSVLKAAAWTAPVVAAASVVPMAAASLGVSSVSAGGVVAG
ncbi:Uncharacterised protein [Acidipropionibacterium jensenii]|uniref:Uncharacterized protein n=1 Tax=Acidipropionibacterium jensenii TaxID=1749 RepID=A0A3S4UXB3_9ACTN|nr:hypothetical protein [Acidipropionibacterium jensenii]VEI02994.1 Uncharacterised protein [Acidipropionibacterium jensenii]